MGPILGKLLTSLGTEKLLKAIILHLGDFLVGKSSNKLDDKGWVPTIEDLNDDATSIYLTSNQQLSDKLWAEVKKALNKK